LFRKKVIHYTHCKEESMKKLMLFFSVAVLSLAVITAVPGLTYAAATISSADYKAGDTVTIEGTIAPGQDLYIAIAAQQEFAPQDTDGVHESKRLKKDAEKKGFKLDSKIPALYYMLTTNPDKFGKVTEKRFGGPSFFTQGGKRGLYGTTMFKLSKFDQLDAQAKGVLGPIKSGDQWNFFTYAHESSYGMNTITKEATKVGSG
jgi:hypothetical protein